MDSWKEIAEYLGRDVRTAIRWESQGLPVHRIPGGRGTSVFALSNEIDAWMLGRPGAPPADVQPTRVAVPPSRRRATTRIVTLVAVCLLVLSLVPAAFGLRRAAGADKIASLRVSVTPTDISLIADSGEPRVIHRFQSDRAVPIHDRPVRVVDLDGDGVADIVAGISFFADSALNMMRAGELLNISVNGELRWRFAFDDVLTFGDETVRGPWALAAWEAFADPTAPRLAVAGHDHVWWASMVAVIDDRGRRESVFVNPGWIESLLWLGSTRLAAAGFSNARNEAMFAVIDPDAGPSQAPGSAGTSFACTGCSAKPPFFYATFPRSELNLLTGSPFNRARVSIAGDRVLVTTSEIGTSPATAIYEFDRNLRFVRANFSDAYWDEHGRLERDGKLAHGRDQCPDRDGLAFHVWDAAAGQWRGAISPT